MTLKTFTNNKTSVVDKHNHTSYDNVKHATKINNIFFQSVPDFLKSKSNWLAMGMLLTSVGLFIAGDMKSAIESLVAGFTLLFAKDAIAKTGS